MTVRDVIPVSAVRLTAVAPPAAATIAMACSPDPPAATSIVPPAEAIWSAVNVTFELTTTVGVPTNAPDELKKLVPETVTISESAPVLIIIVSEAPTAPSLIKILSLPASVLRVSPAPPPELTCTTSSPAPRFRVSAPVPTVITSIWPLPVTVTPSSFNVIVFFDAVDVERLRVVSPARRVAVISPVVAAAMV